MSGEKSSDSNSLNPLLPAVDWGQIKQAIQGLFTAGTSPQRKRSVANGDWRPGSW